MSLSRKQKLSVIPFLLYWPILFTLMHIPIPSGGNWQITIALSDKILHCFAYLILLFVVWFALKQDAKVNWKKAITWWIILAMAIYGLIDEWLQSYVGRSPDITDFASDMIAVVLGLLMLSVIPFWPAGLAVTGIVTFILIQFIRINFTAQLPILVTVSYILLLSFFTVLWIQCMKDVKRSGIWLISLFAGPLSFLLIMELSFKMSNYDFSWLNTAFAAVAICAVVLVYYKHRHFLKNVC